MDDSAKGKNDCNPDFPIFVLGDNYPTVRDHVGDAISQNLSPSTLNRLYPVPPGRSWLAPYKGPGKPCTNAAGTQCDEYPWASSTQGLAVPTNAVGIGGVSLRSVPSGDNMGAGGKLGAFYAACRVRPLQQYKVLAIKGLNSGYVCTR
jgi:hypothetical protein